MHRVYTTFSVKTSQSADGTTATDTRLQMTSKPFVNCALDFGGPYITVQGRGRACTKRYLSLFLCLQTHCYHLEMATALDTGAFLNAFVRMAARRGWPKNMPSDNGTKEIKELVGQLDHDQLQRMTSNQGVTWHWNPLSAPHFGGVFESMDYSTYIDNENGSSSSLSSSTLPSCTSSSE